MRTSFLYTTPAIAISLTALWTTACGDSGPSAADLNTMMPPATTGGSMAAAGTTATPTAGSTGTAGTAAVTGGTGGTGVIPSGGMDTGGSGPAMTGGTGGTGPTGGTGGSGGGAGGAPPTGPYAPRTGTFKMLVYSKTAAFRHDSIANGIAMLQTIATEQGFTVKTTETNEDITAEGLKQYEIIFFMNSTGDIFNATEQKAYEDWMTTQNGAFAGTHSATDTENGWSFYSEVTGQYYDGHGAANTSDTIKFEATAADFPAVKGIPNPWQRNEEWYKFNSYQQWSVKPGFKILGRKTADTQPITWAREWGNFRAFYSAIGHDKSVFTDPVVKKHITGGIMWAVRREALIK
jgi:type 1 glutamine amidotransferase